MTPARKRELEVAAALLLLQRRAKRGLRAAVHAIGLPLLKRATAAQADGIVAAVTGRAILAVRTTAVASSRNLSTLPDELATAARVENDAVSLRSARSLARQYNELLVAEEGDVKAAVAGLAPRLERTAVTEAMRAWNLETLALSARAHRAGLVVTDTWHAMLDACEVCWELDGQSRTRPETFDVAPPVHPSCFCWIDTVFEQRIAA